MKRVLPAAIVILISVMAVLAIVRVRFSSDVFELLPQDLPEAQKSRQQSPTIIFSRLLPERHK